MSVTSPEDISLIFQTALKAASDLTPRTVQSREGRIGPSDLGFCRNKAALMAKGVQQTDSRSVWPALVGTAVHGLVEGVVMDLFPTWQVEPRVTATFPNGAQVSGNVDILVPEWNLVLDIKTVDGFERIKRYGSSQNHKYQRHTYALGAIQGGLIGQDGAPVSIGNVYLDRSGQESEPYVVIEPFDPMLTDEISAWIDDVIYAVQQQEPASQDVAAPICERICEFYTVCRGGALPTHEPLLLDDPEVSLAMKMYDEGRVMEREARKMKDQAKTVLDGINGSDGEFQVRWTFIPPSEVEAYQRAASYRIDVTRVRKGS
jgi:hypothetical protein